MINGRMSHPQTEVFTRAFAATTTSSGGWVEVIVVAVLLAFGTLIVQFKLLEKKVEHADKGTNPGQGINTQALTVASQNPSKSETHSDPNKSESVLLKEVEQSRVLKSTEDEAQNNQFNSINSYLNQPEKINSASQSTETSFQSIIGSQGTEKLISLKESKINKNDSKINTSRSKVSFRKIYLGIFGKFRSI